MSFDWICCLEKQVIMVSLTSHVTGGAEMGSDVKSVCMITAHC